LPINAETVGHEFDKAEIGGCDVPKAVAIVAWEDLSQSGGQSAGVRRRDGWKGTILTL